MYSNQFQREAYQICAPKTSSVQINFIGQNFELAPVCKRITLEHINYDFVNLNPFLKNVVRRFGKAVEVKNSEIDAMKDCLKNYSDSFSCNSGDHVKILSGVFKNKVGFVDQIENSYLTLLVNSLKIKLSYNTTKLKVV